MLIAQISDPHIAVPGSTLREMVDTPARLVDAFESLSALPATPDVILFTGDLVNDGTPAEYALLAETLESAPCPILPIPGNHDDASLLSATFAASGVCPVELPGGDRSFHYVVDDHPVRFVALDSTRIGHHSGLITPEAAHWLDGALAARPSAPTIVFMHHTPYPTGSWWFDYNGVAGADLLRETFARHPQVVRCVSGHVHRATSTQWGSLVLSTAPSTAYLSGTGSAGPDGDGVPWIIDQRAPVTLLRWTGDGIVASETDLPLPDTRLDLRDLNSKWAGYEPAARAGGPISKAEFGG